MSFLVTADSEKREVHKFEEEVGRGWGGNMEGFGRAPLLWKPLNIKGNYTRGNLLGPAGEKWGGGLEAVRYVKIRPSSLQPEF